jgi:hypothetical protein
METRDGISEGSPSYSDARCAHLLIEVDEKQNLLEIISPNDRLARLEEILSREVRRLSAAPEVVKRREERTAEQRLLRKALTRILKSSSFPDRILGQAHEIVTRSAPRHDEATFTDRGLSSAGTTRMRQLLERHELVLDVADEALQVLIKALGHDQLDDIGKSLRSLSLLVIPELRRDAADARVSFGVERGKSN